MEGNRSFQKKKKNLSPEELHMFQMFVAEKKKSYKTEGDVYRELRTLASVRVSSLCGSPRQVLVEVLAALAVQSHRVVIAHAASVDLCTQTDTKSALQIHR